MHDPRDYIDAIQQNLKKLQQQGGVTPTESALFGIIDGLAGLQRVTMERVATLEQALQGRTEEAARRRHEVIEATHHPDRHVVAPVRDATPLHGR
jgi:hypothetical protein